ncbi:thioredoxin family protein [Flavobacterium piscinae]|uniref:thioredoxin family protein n=1 Tax=Flavobacterium piscinae TaxID=2506424 RepID=UPI00198E0415|nr:thioredoxin fold domain-containing protein [Flavobacterium piscinae]MBC8884301.1 thioredoxin family protein [Flavobacterium piscinae]
MFVYCLGSLFLSFRIPTKEATVAKGIDFFKGTFQEALALAEKEQKYVFVEVYATWCGPCKQLKRTTFKDKEVGVYFNKNFINIAIDGETEEGDKILSRYNIRSYPTLLILDAKGRVLTRQTGFMKPYILINFGRRVVP